MTSFKNFFMCAAIAGLLLVPALSAQKAEAATIQYTVDNTASLLINGVDMTGSVSTGVGDWYTASTYTFTLSAGTDTVLTWNIANEGGAASSSNPMAFIGRVDVDDDGVWDYESTYSAGSPWMVTGTGLYEVAYGSGAWGTRTDVDFSGSYWIGGSGTSMSISLALPAATPIPGAVWLLGSGLAGLVSLRRKFA